MKEKEAKVLDYKFSDFISVSDKVLARFESQRATTIIEPAIKRYHEGIWAGSAKAFIVVFSGSLEDDAIK